MIVDAHAVEFSKTAVPLWGGHPRRSPFRPYARGRSKGRPESIALRTNRGKLLACRGDPKSERCIEQHRERRGRNARSPAQPRESEPDPQCLRAARRKTWRERVRHGGGPRDGQPGPRAVPSAARGDPAMATQLPMGLAGGSYLTWRAQCLRPHLRDCRGVAIVDQHTPSM
jgi:hypothetical protein